MMRLSRLCAVFPLGFGLLISASALAVRPDEATPEALAQVQRAIDALAPILRSESRTIKSTDRGSLERAIRAYAPKRPWPVSEGTVSPLRKAEASKTEDACPAGMALVKNRFCVDQYEAALDERMPDGTFLAHSPFESPEDKKVYIARSVRGVVPQSYISAKQAGDACKEAGKRLCSPVEWRVACGGSQGYAYPYGPERKPKVCNDSGKAPMLALHADKMQKGFGREELNDPRLNQLEGTLAKTGAFEGCVTDTGLSDMMGNLHEWTNDPNGTFQGGYYLDTREHGEGCAYRTIAHNADYHDYSTGFRCCKEPE
jgi:formylglycine-generating enzyme